MMAKLERSRRKVRENHREFPSVKKEGREKTSTFSLGKKDVYREISLLSLTRKKSRIIENFPREEKGTP